MSSDIFKKIKTSNLKTIKEAFLTENKKEKDEFGAYLSFYGAKRGKKEIFDFLFNNNVPIRGSDNEKNTILFYAIKGNNLHIIKQILTKNIKLDQTNKFGAGAILYINKYTKIEIIEYLISKGLDINQKFTVNFSKNKIYQRNLLFYAIKYNHFSLIKFLVKNKVNFSTSLDCNNQKYKMFYFILYYGNIKTIQFFIEQGINQKLNKENIKKLVKRCIETSNLDVLKILLEINKDIMDFHYGKNNRYTTLNYAIHLNQFKIVNFLLKTYPNIIKIDEYYFKPIHYAVKSANKSIFRLFKDDVNAIIDPSITCLELACKLPQNKNKQEIINEILENKNFDFTFEFYFENEGIDFSEEISTITT